jgi:hypothetical protein
MPVVHVTSSRKLATSKSHSDFVCQLDQPLKDVRSIALLHASIPNSFYTIVDAHNTFVLARSGTDHAITLTAGVYTATELAAHLQVKLAAAVTGFTVSYSTSLYKIVFTDPSVSSYTLTISSDRLQRVLGFSASSLASAARVATPPHVVQLSSNMVLVMSRAFKAKTHGPSPSSFAIPLDVSSGGIVSFNAKSHYSMRAEYEFGIDLYQVDIRLTDAHGDDLDTQGGAIDLVFNVQY